MTEATDLFGEEHIRNVAAQPVARSRSACGLPGSLCVPFAELAVG